MEQLGTIHENVPATTSGKGWGWGGGGWAAGALDAAEQRLQVRFIWLGGLVCGVASWALGCAIQARQQGLAPAGVAHADCAAGSCSMHTAHVQETAMCPTAVAAVEAEAGALRDGWGW